MLVEFIGCTSSGKTTLLKAAFDNNNVDAYSAYDYFLTKSIKIPVTNQRLKSILVELLLSPKYLLLFSRFYRYISFSLWAIWHYPDTVLMKIAKIRNLFKQLALYMTLKKITPEHELVIFDEGTLHSIHNLFIHYKYSPGKPELEIFLSIVPLPDFIFLIEADKSVILNRLQNRNDPPRRHLTFQQWDSLVDNASRAFTFLKTAIDSDKIIIIDNSDADSARGRINTELFRLKRLHQC